LKLAVLRASFDAEHALMEQTDITGKARVS
jgi:hypothetical protein